MAVSACLYVIRIHLLPGRALRRRPWRRPRRRPRSESTSCPEGHYDIHCSIPSLTYWESESTSCPEGHYDRDRDRRIAADYPHQNPPPARKGITTVAERVHCLLVRHYQNPPPARKGITTPEWIPGDRPAQPDIRIHLLPGRALRRVGLVVVVPLRCDQNPPPARKGITTASARVR